MEFYHTKEKINISTIDQRSLMLYLAMNFRHYANQPKDKFLRYFGLHNVSNV